MFRNYCAVGALSSLVALLLGFQTSFAQEETTLPPPAQLTDGQMADCQTADCAAQAACDPGLSCSGAGHRKNCLGIEWSGYVEAGVLCNTYGAHTNGYTSSSSHNGGAFDALYLRASKSADNDGCGTAWGFQTDFMFGENARFMQVGDGLDEDWDTSSDDTYGFAMPQLYAELAINDWTITAGHFYTHIGYECTPASDRFFYSRGIAFDNIPATHTGVKVAYNGFKNLDVMVGWTNGHDIGFTDENGGSNFIASFAYHLNDAATLTYGLCVGDEYDYKIGDYREHGFGAVQSVVFDYNLTEKLEWVTEFDYWNYQESDSATAVIGEHLYYTVNDCWKWGARLEWLKYQYYGDDDAEEEFAMTFGANWTPFAEGKLIIRPEIRYDKMVNGTPFGKLADKDDQLTLGFDVIYNF